MAAAAAGSAAGVGPGDNAATAREPELLTHEDAPGAYNYYGSEDYPDEEYEGGEFAQEPDDFFDQGDDDDDGVTRRRRLWRRVRRSCYVAAGLMFLGPIAAFAVGYAMWNPASPEQVAAQQAQTINILYSNNQEMTRIVPNSGQLTMIHSAARDGTGDVAKTVIDASVAAEDPTFYTNAGIDFQGILRAIWSQLTGADSSGGSTLTQEYIKLSTGQDQHTYLRKFKEIVLAVKMTREQSKDQIMLAYLNTAYYGRGANGIAAASQAFFGKGPKDLNASEAAVLAGMVQSPTANDPALYPDTGQRRWTYVVDNMLKDRFISAEDRATMRLPQTRNPSDSKGNTQNLTADQFQIRQQVLAELAAEGYDQNTLARGGYTITTTIDPTAQQAAEQAVANDMKGYPDNIKPSLVAVDPKSGDVKAYWGGTDVGGYDFASAPQAPGSSFKPFVVVAGLEQNPPAGIGLTYNGTSPQTIAGSQFSNNPGIFCDDQLHCGVREAMTKSVNTVFVNMAVQFQTQNVRKAAIQAGIPEKDPNGNPNLQSPDGAVEAGIALGQYPVRPIDMAGAYSTFAAEGMKVTPHFVKSIKNFQGQQDFETSSGNTPRPAFAPDPVQSKNIADNVTETLLDVARHSNRTLANNRPVASKSGTNQYGNGSSSENANAWYVGYTPQITTAVAMLAENNNVPAPLKDKTGTVNLYGATVSGLIWRDFMNTYLAHQPILQFPKPVPIGQFDLLPPPPPPPPPPTSNVPSQPPATVETTQSQPTETTRTRPFGGGGGGGSGGGTCGLLGCSGGGSTSGGAAPPSGTSGG